MPFQETVNHDQSALPARNTVSETSAPNTPGHRHEHADTLRSFHGADGTTYEVYPVEEFYNGKYGLRDTFVIDPGGNKFYIAHKNPEVQAAAYSIGEQVAAHDPALSRLKFPGRRTETFEGQPVTLVEYLEDYTELGHIPGGEQLLTPAESAFIGIYSLFIGNHDMKDAHLLVSEDQRSIGLIDMDRAGRYDVFETRSFSASFRNLGNPPPEMLSHYYHVFHDLHVAEAQEMAGADNEAGQRLAHTAVQRAQDGAFRRLVAEIYGFDPEEKHNPAVILGASATLHLVR